MTTPTNAQGLWTAMPGWGIVADLTPPELIGARQLKVLRRVMGGALVLLIVLCGGGYFLAARKDAAAADRLEDVQVTTSSLQTKLHKYVGITKIQGTVDQVDAQVAQLMTADVDVAKLLAHVYGSVPKTMTISQESLTISEAAAVAGTSDSTELGTGLDTSGQARIGTMTISGTATALSELPNFVDVLSAIPGVVDVVPTSNTRDETGVQYSVTLSLTDELLSHRYDAKNGGN